LAKLYSEDPGTASNGGALGFVEKGTLFQSFEETAFQMESGDISDVVETPVGLHLIQLIEKRGDKASMRHILIRVEVTSVDESTVLDTLRHIRERVLAGESFEDMAQKYSQDETTKDVGGDLGWLPPDQLQIEAFKSAIDTLQSDEITRPFKTQFGYHIVKLEGRRSARKVSLEEDWEQVEYWALSTKRQEVIEEWIAELRKKIYIKINEDML
jgi:peptidyl-prolyl cis-trans isomerase SurA